MRRGAIFAFVLAATSAFAQQPEECIVKTGEAVTVSYESKSYRLANEACRAQFLSDPERYSQLYDALLELEREGTPLRAAPASLVPS